ncbi:hypothetical protein STEG23_014462, partial [Scotinomys teguina]
MLAPHLSVAVRGQPEKRMKIVQVLSLNWLLCYFFPPFDIDASIEETSDIKGENPEIPFQTSAVTIMNGTGELPLPLKAAALWKAALVPCQLLQSGKLDLPLIW